MISNTTKTVCLWVYRVQRHYVHFVFSAFRKEKGVVIFAFFHPYVFPSIRCRSPSNIFVLFSYHAQEEKCRRRCCCHRHWSTANPFNGYTQADSDASQIGHQHPEDYTIYEDGVSGKVCTCRTWAATSPSIWRGRHCEWQMENCDLTLLYLFAFLLQAFYDKSGAAEVTKTDDTNKLIVAISSDRGLCGAVHTNVAKIIRNELGTETPDTTTQTKVFCVGDKSRALLQRYETVANINSIVCFLLIFLRYSHHLTIIHNHILWLFL